MTRKTPLMADSHFLGIDDVVWQALIAAVVTIVIAWMQRSTKSAVDATKSAIDTSAQNALAKTDEVKRTLAASTQATDAKLSEIRKVGTQNSSKILRAIKKVDVVHGLVNGARRKLLFDKAVLTRRLADHTGSPEDIALAEAAEKELMEHDDLQAAIDQKAAADKREEDQRDDAEL